jgi:hypothetical protein
LKLRNANFTETGTPNNQFSAGQLNRFSLADLHVIEPRIKGYPLVVEGQPQSHPNDCDRSLKEKSLRPAV